MSESAFEPVYDRIGHIDMPIKEEFAKLTPEIQEAADAFTQALDTAFGDREIHKKLLIGELPGSDLLEFHKYRETNNTGGINVIRSLVYIPEKPFHKIPDVKCAISIITTPSGSKYYEWHFDRFNRPGLPHPLLMKHEDQLNLMGLGTEILRSGSALLEDIK